LKRLFLLRHAKAKAGSEDAVRPLAGRGREDAARLGRYLRKGGHVPDLVLCSPARRTRETIAILVAELDREPQTRFVSALYLADAGTILCHIRQAPDAALSLMIVGHNPGLEQCALLLARPEEDRKTSQHLAAMAEKFPTCALAVFDFAVARWSDVTPADGEATLFLRPPDLAA
jgi:phosphohistidine phosphatase